MPDLPMAKVGCHTERAMTEEAFRVQTSRHQELRRRKRRLAYPLPSNTCGYSSFTGGARHAVYVARPLNERTFGCCLQDVPVHFAETMAARYYSMYWYTVTPASTCSSLGRSHPYWRLKSATGLYPVALLSISLYIRC